MNRYYHQPHVMQPTRDYVSPVPSPWSVYDHRSTPVYYQPMMPMFYPQSMQYVDEVAILEEATHSYIGQNNAGRSGGSGLSIEEISKRLHVYAAAERETSAEVETCSICLDDCEKKEKTARLECGHRFHVDCITHWLMSKNVCPMCRSTALH